MKILVTGAAGFIGFHVTRSLLERGEEITGIDNLNNYYEVTLKEARLRQLRDYSNFSFERTDIADGKALRGIFENKPPRRVIHLAAQAGVRYSLQHPEAYVRSNLDGFVNILEACRHADIEHLVYASSSSVYGANTKTPFSVDDRVDQPVSLYGATKRANELMAYTYNSLFGIPTTGLRFFTVYGPWGRPDMAYFKFAVNILTGVPIDIYNYGHHARDFTYIDDIVQGVTSAVDLAVVPDRNNPDKSNTQAGMAENYRLYNLGNNKPVDLMYFISLLEELIGKRAVTRMLPKQPGDVDVTFADIDSATRDLAYTPRTTLEQGLKKFVVWFMQYHGYKK